MAGRRGMQEGFQYSLRGDSPHLLNEVAADLAAHEGLGLHGVALAPPVHIRHRPRAVRLRLNPLQRQQRRNVVLRASTQSPRQSQSKIMLLDVELRTL